MLSLPHFSQFLCQLGQLSLLLPSPYSLVLIIPLLITFVPSVLIGPQHLRVNPHCLEREHRVRMRQPVDYLNELPENRLYSILTLSYENIILVTAGALATLVSDFSRAASRQWDLQYEDKIDQGSIQISPTCTDKTTPSNRRPTPCVQMPSLLSLLSVFQPVGCHTFSYPHYYRILHSHSRRTTRKRKSPRRRATIGKAQDNVEVGESVKCPVKLSQCC